MAIVSALDIVQAAYGLLGIWDGQSPLTAFELQTAQAVLNDLIDSWNLEQLSIYTSLAYEFPFVPNVNSYQLGLPNGQFSFNALGTALTITSGAATPAPGLTIIGQGILPNTTIVSGAGNSWVLSQPVTNIVTNGLAGICMASTTPTGVAGYNWAVPRPTRVERISIKFNENTSSPYEIPIQIMDLEHWQNIPVKNVASTYPLGCYNDESFPYMNLNFWPVPAGPANCVVYAWDPLSQLTSLTQQVELPPGYNSALKFNLAVELAPYFEREPSPTIAKRAMQTKHNLANINQQTPELHFDPMFTGRGGALQLALASRGGIVV